MDSISENQFFLLIKKQKITFSVFNLNNGLVFTKEIFFRNYTTNNLNELLENFLKNNVFEIEKNLQTFIKNINIILESDNFFIAGFSIRHNLKGTSFHFSQINDILIDIRNQFTKYSYGYETVHMVIEKINIDGNSYKNFQKINNVENLVIQVNFICLKEQIISAFKKILSKYQISIVKTLSYDYLKDRKKYPGENIFKVANDNLIGLHTNEVLVAKKTLKKLGFFEKFFKFFT